MKKKTVTRALALFLCAASLLAVLAFPASADTGPKPSVRVNFLHLGSELCYGTLLSATPSTGPASVWNGDERWAMHNGNELYASRDLDEATWRAFVEYKDKDGFYFLQETWRVSETKEIAWTYYPPSPFKILLYFPEKNAFAVSGICERYAFDTYYTVDMDGIQIDKVEYDEDSSTDERIDAWLHATPSYEYRDEILSLIARILITIAIEIALALCFALREKKQLLVIAATNIVTQIALNVLLNVVNYRSGPQVFVILYLLLELAVFAIETVVYCLLLPRVSVRKRPPARYVLYALVANAASFGAGIALAYWIPGIF